MEAAGDTIDSCIDVHKYMIWIRAKPRRRFSVTHDTRVIIQELENNVLVVSQEKGNAPKALTAVVSRPCARHYRFIERRLLRPRDAHPSSRRRGLDPQLVLGWLRGVGAHAGLALVARYGGRLPRH